MKRLAAVMVAGGLAAATASAQYARVWSQATPPAPQVLDRLNLRLGWRSAVPTEGYRDGIATVQHLGDTVVFQTRRGTLTALDPQTGAAKWQRSVGLAYPVTHKVGANDALILVANGTRIFALDRATGSELWSVDLAATPSSPPAASADALYVCLTNGRLSAYAFPFETAPAPVTGTPGSTTAGAGRPKEPAGPLSTGPAAASGSGAVRTPPVPARPSAGGNVPKPAEPTRVAAPTMGGGRTVTTSTAMDTRSASTTMQVTGGRTAVGGESVNRTGRGPEATGGPRLLWDYQTNLRISERPVIGEKSLFVIGTGRDALFINRDGSKPLEFTAEANFSAPLGQYGEVVYAGCANGSVYAFDLLTRVTLWQVTVNGAITAQPLATEEDLFVSAEGNGLTRFARATGQILWQNPAVVRFIAANPKFVYGLDRTGRLTVLDHSRGTTLTTLDVRDFSVSLANEETDRLILAGADGTVISLHDRAFGQSLRLRSPQAPPVAAPPPAPPPAEGRPEPPAAPAARPAVPPPPRPMPPPNPPATPPNEPPDRSGG